MPRRPVNQIYNEFDPEQKAAIEQLAIRLAVKEKNYLDRELAPFVYGRVLVLYGIAGSYSQGTIAVTVAGTNGENVTFRARGITEPIAKKVIGKAVRILYNTLDNAVYYDDIA